MAAATTARPTNTLWPFLEEAPATAVSEPVGKTELALVFSDKVVFALNLLMAGPEGVAVGRIRVPVTFSKDEEYGFEGFSDEIGLDGCSSEDKELETGLETYDLGGCSSEDTGFEAGLETYELGGCSSEDTGFKMGLETCVSEGCTPADTGFEVGLETYGLGGCSSEDTGFETGLETPGRVSVTVTGTVSFKVEPTRVV
jgi:hypothetical protein